MASVFNFLFRHLKIIVIVLAIMFMVSTGLVISFLQPENMLMQQQQIVLKAVERRSGKILLPIMADDYKDQWDFNREEAATALGEVGSQFIVLSTEVIDPVYKIDGDAASVTMGIRLTGNGGPMAHEVMRQANRLKSPFVFSWEKQSRWPWSWRLVRIENPSLPANLHGYKPLLKSP